VAGREFVGGGRPRLRGEKLLPLGEVTSFTRGERAACKRRSQRICQKNISSKWSVIAVKRKRASIRKKVVTKRGFSQGESQTGDQVRRSGISLKKKKKKKRFAVNDLLFC